MMKQCYFDIFLCFSILTFCSSQRLLYHCDFDAGMTGNCRFDITTGGPSIQAPNGMASLNNPTKPLSDVKSILSPTTPNNEFCEFPYPIPPQTWPNYFCQQNSISNYTCQTKSGTGNCIIGRYGIVEIPSNGYFEHMYTTINTVQDHVNNFQCLDFYYYMTSTSNAKISVGWSAGAAPYPITETRSQSENRWHRHLFTYANPRQSNYYIWFRMIRDGGSAPFAFALDEIKIFDGPCELPTTSNPEITISSRQTSTAALDLTSSINEISTDESVITSAESSETDIIATVSSSSSTKTTTQLPATVASSMTTANDTNIGAQTLIPTIETNTKPNLISSTLTIASIIATTTTIFSTIPNKKSDLPLVLGLTLGIGLLFILLLIAALVYHHKVIKPKKRVFVRGHGDNEILMKRTTKNIK